MSQKLPRAYVYRRLHSLTGLFLVLFLFEHLLTNSQAALFFGEDGAGFVRMVNLIHSLPFLPVIEIGLLAVPFLVHGIYGFLYLREAKINSVRSDGSTPSLQSFTKNRGFTWQRLSAWVLLIMVVVHVIEMRFLHYPVATRVGSATIYLTEHRFDEGLYTLAPRLGVAVVDKNRMEGEKTIYEEVKSQYQNRYGQEMGRPHFEGGFSEDSSSQMIHWQELQQRRQFLENLSRFNYEGEHIAIASEQFGLATLMVVRETFKSLSNCFIYSVFVIAAAFHALNGLWTSLITWGVTLSSRSQKGAYMACHLLMLLFSFLGLAAVWGTYWINLRS